MLGRVRSNLVTTDVLAAYTRCLRCRFVRVTNGLRLNDDMAVIQCAVATHDYSIRAELSTSRLQLRNCIGDRWISPAGLVPLGGNDADGRVGALWWRKQYLDLARVAWCYRSTRRQIAVNLVPAATCEGRREHEEQSTSRSAIHG